jgi:hypothetical protein
MLSLVLGLLATAGSLASSPSASASSLSTCSTVVGAPFSYNAVGGAHLSGDHYGVEALGMSCSVARSWVAKLTHAVPAGHASAAGGYGLESTNGHTYPGPTGYTCVGAGIPTGLHKAPAISGWCWKGGSYPLSPQMTGYIEWVTRPNQG